MDETGNNWKGNGQGNDAQNSNSFGGGPVFPQSNQGSPAGNMPNNFQGPPPGSNTPQYTASPAPSGSSTPGPPNSSGFPPPPQQNSQGPPFNGPASSGFGSPSSNGPHLVHNSVQDLIISLAVHHSLQWHHQHHFTGQEVIKDIQWVIH